MTFLKPPMENPGKASFTNADLLHRYGRDNPYGAENTVAVHIRHLREKIEYNPAEPPIPESSVGTRFKMGD